MDKPGILRRASTLSRLVMGLGSRPISDCRCTSRLTARELVVPLTKCERYIGFVSFAKTEGGKVSSATIGD